MTPPADYYCPSASDFEAFDEAQQERARGEVEGYVDAWYPFAKGWQRDELVDAGEDALNSIEDWGLELPSCEGPRCSLQLSGDALAVLRHVFALKWREQCGWLWRHRGRERPSGVLFSTTTRQRGDRRLRSRRPAARRRVRARARGPDGDDPEPPGVAPGGALALVGWSSWT
jgi:hypothetical protein